MNSFIGWIGGKKQLRKEIINRFPNEFSRYIEVFGGAGWVLFGSDKHAELEVYNDINSDLVNLFSCVKENCDEVQKELELILNSRELFESYKFELQSDYLTNIQRAARFFYLIAYSYGCNGREFSCRSKGIIKPVEYLKQVQKRLDRVVIENKSFDNLIKLYDRENALIYCDPPYFGTEKYYTYSNFNMSEHLKLKDILQNIKGKFILSYNDCPQARELYQTFRIEEISRNNNLASRYGKNSLYSELIIRNY